jgi:ABC-type transporter Mla subunit MlaD
VVTALVALVWMISIFGDLQTAVSGLNSFDIYVQFPQAPGVDRNTPVRLAGYQIGRVVEVEPPTNRVDLKTGLTYLQTLVVIAVDKRFKDIPSNVRVKLMKRGLGSSYIELDLDPTAPLVRLDPNNPESVYLYNGARLQGATGATSEFFPEESQRKLESLINGLTTLINNANVIIGDTSNQNNIKSSLANLSDATKQATVTLRELEKLSDAGTKSLNKADTTLDKVSDSFIQTSMELNKTIVQFRLMLEEINKGQGTAGRLIYDASLYQNLLDSSRELQTAVEQVKLMAAQWREKGVKLKF